MATAKKFEFDTLQDPQTGRVLSSSQPVPMGINFTYLELFATPLDDDAKAILRTPHTPTDMADAPHTEQEPSQESGQESGQAPATDDAPSSHAPACIYTQEDMDKALKDSHTEGYEAGRAAGTTETADATQQTLAQTAAALLQQIHACHTMQTELAQTYNADALGLAVAVVRKLFPAMNTRYGTEEVAGLVESSIARMMEPSDISVQVHSSVAEDLRNMLTGVEALHINTDDAIAPGDAKVHWQGGLMERNGAHLWQAIDDIIAAWGNGGKINTHAPISSANTSAPAPPAEVNAEATIEEPDTDRQPPKEQQEEQQTERKVDNEQEDNGQGDNGQGDSGQGDSTPDGIDITHTEDLQGTEETDATDTEQGDGTDGPAG